MSDIERRLTMVEELIVEHSHSLYQIGKLTERIDALELRAQQNDNFLAFMFPTLVERIKALEANDNE